MEKTTNFSDLNKDIIIAVLCSCDVCTVLRVEQTCRDFRDLISSRHLWLTLVQNLDYDHAPALLPHETLQSLSVERLRDMAVRSVRGRLNWTSSKGPKVTRTTVLKLNEEHENDYKLGVLVPGGKYFVFTDLEGCFHCYDTEKEVNVCSYHPLFDRGIVDIVVCMDCLNYNDGSTLILAYLSTPFPLSGRQQSVTVVRLDVQSGTSSIVQFFSYSPGFDQDNGITKIRLTDEVVVAAMFNSIFVANWRTGEAAMTERMSLDSDLHIAQGHVLCDIRMETGGIAFAAAPLSLIFAAVKSSTTGKKNSFSSPVPIQSEAVFIHVLPLAYPEAEHVSVVFSSTCTESWKFPSLRESDAVGVTTRILQFVFIDVGPERYYMVNHLEFSPITELSIDDASRIATIGNAATIGNILTCQRRSPLYLFNASENVDDVNWAGTSRTGHAVGTITKRGGFPTDMCAIDLLGLVERPVRKSHPNNSGTDSRSLAKHDGMLVLNEIRLSENISTNGMDYLGSLNIEEYSGALWYFADDSVYIHCFN